ncbi:tRNA-dihydrouridine(16/17) synthase [NAD(P)(+)] [Histomonas meleagridis]|uniref:tRNA-dihydrouridine(16/17) synthase [NAD(P)(+)] n=1 Tax=Histomonas meleagridis TaxID=135588 RepID=UPI00355A67EB|nr:tRNA-dihydrouridine(16/17) synthase [NAD(P)(+)] [Histomonas meleagridis]KAH0799170.1 tRNA-dihydrouridine(16/17) synthase [NAD(P)(+)] [Histomonas meleagridis]
MEETQKNKEAWDFWSQFGSNPICLAPMVELGDLPFRILVRRHKVNICWTGMINANQWNMSKKFRESVMRTAECDKPLVAQISGSIESDLIGTAKSISTRCCAIDINLGCCQKVAKRGRFGYFMVDTNEKRINVLKLIKTLSSEICVPLFAKIRMIDDNIESTVEFAKQLESVGVKLITVHGRNTEQDKNGDVNVQCIREIVKSVGIPVIANGGIKSPEEAEEIIKKTGAAGAMVAQALLKNPVLFDKDANLNGFDVAREYISLYKEFGGNFDATRRHMFYIFDKELGEDGVKRGNLARCRTPEELETFIDALQNDCTCK